MSQENSPSLSYISRGASLLVVLGVLAGGVLAYAQSATYGKITIATYKDEHTPVADIQVQQILTPTEKVKEYCVSNSMGQCTFAMTEKDGEVYFLGKGKDGYYGNLANPNYGCKRVTFQYDSAVGKIYQYVDGVKGDSAQRYTIFAESFYKKKCVPNATGGYDLVDKEPTSAPVTPSPVAIAPEKKYYEEKKSDEKKPEEPKKYYKLESPIEDDYEDVEDETGRDVDVKLTDVVLGSKKTQRRKSTRALGLRFKIAVASNTSDTLVVRTGMNCTLRDGYPNDESWQSWDFKVAKFGSQQIFYEFGAEDEKWAALKQKKSFMCYVAISGIVPASAPLELWQDADAGNNRLRFKLFWGSDRWQIGKLEPY